MSGTEIKEATAFWEKKYAEILKEDISIGSLRGVFVAYNTNIDAIKHVDEKFAELLLSSSQSAAANSSPIDAVNMVPKQIETVSDLVAGIASSMRAGKALQISFVEDGNGVAAWLDKNVKPDEARMGGQAGITANILSVIDVRNVIIYTPLLPKRQAELFVKNDNLVVPAFTDEGIMELKKPLDAYNPDDTAKINWIFEYRVGSRLGNIVSPRANRFIAASRPEALKLHKDKRILAHAGDIARLVDCAIFSGLQITKHTYRDGTTYDLYIREAAEFAKLLKEANPDLKLHLEFASIQNEDIRREILTTFAPQVHSLGINEVEIVDALETLGEHDIAYNIKTNECPISLYTGVKKLMQTIGIKRVHIHSLGHFIAVTHKDYGINIENTLKGLLYSSSLGGAKAKLGEIKSKDDIIAGLDVPPSRSGLLELMKLKDHLESIGGFLDDGMGADGDFRIAAIPAKVVDIPKSTVGMGDTISSSAFVTENALHRASLRRHNT